MRKEQGLSLSLADDAALDSMGILRRTSGTSRAYGLTDDEIGLFLAVATAGESGLSLTKSEKLFKAKSPEVALSLELKGLIAYSRDARGRRNLLILTWGGQEAFEAAKRASTPKALHEPVMRARTAY